MAEGASVSDRSTREVIAIIIALMLGASVLIVLTAICVIEIVDSERDTSTATKYLGTLLSSLAFGIGGYMLGYHRGDGKEK
jgi:hypothetical protein